MRNVKRYELPGYCYFVTTIIDGRRPLFRSPDVAQIVVETLSHYGDRGDYILHAFVVMPDHVHLLMTPRGKSISDVMRNIKSWVAKEIRERTEQSGAIWQASFHDTVIRNDDHFGKAVDYIHWNPVQAGFVREPSEYPLSSLASWESGVPAESGLGP
jgi:putative transposase